MNDHIAKVKNDPAGLTASLDYGVVTSFFFNFFFDDRNQTIQQAFATTSCDHKVICKI